MSVFSKVRPAAAGCVCAAVMLTSAGLDRLLFTLFPHFLPSFAVSREAEDDGEVTYGFALWDIIKGLFD